MSCDICDRNWLETETHHVLTRGAGDHDVPEACLNICRFCHSLCHNGAITVKAQLSICYGRDHPEVAEQARQKVWDARRGV